MRFMMLVKATKDFEAGRFAGREAAVGDGQVDRGAGQGRRAARSAGGSSRARRACASVTPTGSSR